MDTQKLYYSNEADTKCTASVVRIVDNAIILDRTVAYPEGGGQEGDRGVITVLAKPEIKLTFSDTQVLNAQQIEDENYPLCKTGGEITHVIAEDSLALLQQVSVGDEVVVEVDQARRDILSQCHSAAHLMYMAVDFVKSGVVEHTIGCHIKAEGGRFDFLTDERFSAEDIQKIEQLSNELIAKDLPITMESDAQYPDVRYWICDNYRIPCGGTHVTRTGLIAPIKVARKNIGKGKERILFTWQA